MPLLAQSKAYPKQRIAASLGCDREAAITVTYGRAMKQNLTSAVLLCGTSLSDVIASIVPVVQLPGSPVL